MLGIGVPEQRVLAKAKTISLSNPGIAVALAVLLFCCFTVVPHDLRPIVVRNKMNALRTRKPESRRC